MPSGPSSGLRMWCKNELIFKKEHCWRTRSRTDSWMFFANLKTIIVTPKRATSAALPIIWTPMLTINWLFIIKEKQDQTCTWVNQSADPQRPYFAKKTCIQSTPQNKLLPGQRKTTDHAVPSLWPAWTGNVIIWTSVSEPSGKMSPPQTWSPQVSTWSSGSHSWESEHSHSSCRWTWKPAMTT